MKKIHQLLLAVLLGLSACIGPEDPLVSEETAFLLDGSVTLENGVLHWGTIQDYEMIVSASDGIKLQTLFQDLSTIPGHVSLLDFYTDNEKRKAYLGQARSSETYLAAEVGDAAFAKLLSPEGLIQIGPWLCKVDMHNELVYAMHESAVPAFKEELLNHNVSHGSVRTFSTSDEVLGLLEAGSRGTVNGRALGLFCQEGSAPGNSASPSSISPLSTGFRGQAFSKYVRGGVWFSLKAGFDHWKRTNNSLDQWQKCKTQVQLRMAFSYSVTCNRGSGQSPSLIISRKDGGYTHTVYSSNKPLRNYFLDAEALFEDPSSERFWSIDVPPISF